MEGDAVEARLEALEATPARSSGAAAELAALHRQRAAAAIDRVQQRRLTWAQQSTAADVPYDAQTEHRSRRIAR
jgi:hypothetical protein